MNGRLNLIKHLMIVGMIVSLFIGPTVSAASRNDADHFTTKDLIIQSLSSYLEPSCGGYCVVGACAHLDYSVSWRGVTVYTVISPKIRHTQPEALVSTYNTIGQEPFLEWRATFGQVMAALNTQVGVAIDQSIHGFVEGGEPFPYDFGAHQAVRFKEADIIGHPMTLLPRMLKQRRIRKPRGMQPRNIPNGIDPPSPDGPPVNVELPNAGNSENKKKKKSKINVRKLLNAGTFLGGEQVRRAAAVGLQALNVYDTMQEILAFAEYLQQIAQFIRFINYLTEIKVRSSFWGNFVNPRFRAPQLMCPTAVRPLQPYYLSFADLGYWRAGWPISDGPLTGEDQTFTILNPFSSDTLPDSSDDFITEPWGHLYPRTGFLGQAHEAKAAAVVAWRAMDVLKHSVTRRLRVGLTLPRMPSGDGHAQSLPRWKMVYPEALSCEATPYHPINSDLVDETSGPGFILPNESGGYAWQYQQSYTCCSNQSGKFLGQIHFAPICLHHFGMRPPE